MANSCFVVYTLLYCYYPRGDALVSKALPKYFCSEKKNNLIPGDVKLNQLPGCIWNIQGTLIIRTLFVGNWYAFHCRANQTVSWEATSQWYD